MAISFNNVTFCILQKYFIFRDWKKYLNDFTNSLIIFMKRQIRTLILRNMNFIYRIFITHLTNNFYSIYKENP